MSLYHMALCTAEEYAAAAAATAAAITTQSLPFLQAPFYGKLQTASGKEVVYMTVSEQNKLIGCGLGVVYTAPGGLRFLYFPYGPVLTKWNNQIVQDMQTFFGPVAVKHRCAFVRLDADEVKCTSVKKPIPDKLARTASLQPRAEWVLDIDTPKDTLWMNMHKHARYNIRLAERAHAQTVVYAPSKAPLETFYTLMQTTGSRDSFGIFDKSYYESYLHTLQDNEGFMVVTSIDGIPAAAGLFVIYDKQVHYVFAGSSNDFRKIAPAYSVIWAALQESQKRGATLCNFGGVTDSVKGQDLGGVSSFKKRFGGYRVEHANPVDMVYSPLKYALFGLYKTLR